MLGTIHVPGGHMPERRAEAKKEEMRQRSCRVNAHPSDLSTLA